MENGFRVLAISILESYSNNSAKFHALILGLEPALECSITMLEVLGESAQIVKQMN